MIWHSQWKSWIMTRSVSAVSACNRRFSSNQLFIYLKLEIPGLNRLLLQGEGKDDVPYKHVHNSQADVWYPISRGSNSIFLLKRGKVQMDRHNVRRDVTKKHHVFRFAKNTFSLSPPPQRSANNVESCAKNLEMTSTGAGKNDKQRSMIRKNLHPAAERYYLLQQQ